MPTTISRIRRGSTGVGYREVRIYKDTGTATTLRQRSNIRLFDLVPNASSDVFTAFMNPGGPQT